MDTAFRRRNLAILFGMQVVAYLNIPLLIFISPLIGVQLAANETLATLPAALLVIAIALSVAPANYLMRRLGRRRAYFIGIAAMMAAGVVGCVAVAAKSFIWVCAAKIVAGFGAAFVPSYRFAAGENVPAERAGRGVSLILLGGVGGGLLGSPLGYAVHDWISDAPFAASFLVLTMTNLAAAGLCFFYRDAQVAAAGEDAAAAPWCSRRLVAAALIGGSAYAVMTLIMTATPISMHHHHGHDLSSTALVIQSHIVAMFLPALFSGKLIDRIGAPPVMAGGALCYLAAVVLAVGGHQLYNYWLALVLLGVGWNFLFVGATVLMTRFSKPRTRFQSQAFCDVIVFSMQALSAFSAGAILAALQWQTLNWLVVPFVAVVAVIVCLLGYSRQRPPEAAL